MVRRDQEGSGRIRRIVVRRDRKNKGIYDSSNFAAQSPGQSHPDVE